MNVAHVRDIACVETGALRGLAWPVHLPRAAKASQRMPRYAASSSLSSSFDARRRSRSSWRLFGRLPGEDRSHGQLVARSVEPAHGLLPASCSTHLARRTLTTLVFVRSLNMDLTQRLRSHFFTLISSCCSLHHRPTIRLARTPLRLFNGRHCTTSPIDSPRRRTQTFGRDRLQPRLAPSSAVEPALECASCARSSCQRVSLDRVDALRVGLS